MSIYDQFPRHSEPTRADRLRAQHAADRETRAARAAAKAVRSRNPDAGSPIPVEARRLLGTIVIFAFLFGAAAILALLTILVSLQPAAH